MTALPFRTVLVIHVELLLCSYCLQGVLSRMADSAFRKQHSHLHISCNTPCLHCPPPPNFLISFECYSRPKRNWRQCICRMFGGETKFITGDVQTAIGTKSRLWGLAAIVGVEENGSDIKRDGKVFCFIICHLGKKTLGGILVPLCHALLRAWQLHFFYHLCYTHVWKNNDKPSPVSVGLKLCLLFSVISTRKA